MLQIGQQIRHPQPFKPQGFREIFISDNTQYRHNQAVRKVLRMIQTFAGIKKVLTFFSKYAYQNLLLLEKQQMKIFLQKNQMRKILYFTIFFIINLFVSASVSGAEEKRFALVIGNAKYKDSPLRNPVNDANDMANTLKGLGFHTIYLKNSGKYEMEKAISEFGRLLQNKESIGLFYYSGHGIQINGRNYLIPIDAQVYSISDIRFMVDAHQLLKIMETAGNKLNIIILDACRNNPFTTNFRSPVQGLAPMPAPTESLIIYATAENKVASETGGRNGMFTKHLLRHIKTPGLEIHDVVMNVRKDVKTESREQQVPCEYSSLTRKFYFVSATEDNINLLKTKDNDYSGQYKRLIEQENKGSNVSEEIIQTIEAIISNLKELELQYTELPKKDYRIQREIETIRRKREIKEKDLYMRTH